MVMAKEDAVGGVGPTGPVEVGASPAVEDPLFGMM